MVSLRAPYPFRNLFQGTYIKLICRLFLLSFIEQRICMRTRHSWEKRINIKKKWVEVKTMDASSDEYDRVQKQNPSKECWWIRAHSFWLVGSSSSSTVCLEGWESKSISYYHQPSTHVRIALLFSHPTFPFSVRDVFIAIVTSTGVGVYSHRQQVFYNTIILAFLVDLDNRFSHHQLKYLTYLFFTTVVLFLLFFIWGCAITFDIAKKQTGVVNGHYINK